VFFAAFRICLRGVLLSIDGQLREFNIDIRHIKKRASRRDIKKKTGPPEILAKKKFTLLLCFKGFARRPDDDSV